MFVTAGDIDNPHVTTEWLKADNMLEQLPVVTGSNPESLRSNGPHNDAIESQFPSQTDAPATDISTQPFFWSSFNISPKRIQNGGWASELTSEDFAISDERAGRNSGAALASERRAGIPALDEERAQELV